MNNVVHKIPVREYRSVEKKNATMFRIPLGMRPTIKGCIPNGMQVPRIDTFSTERYSLTGIWLCTTLFIYYFFRLTKLHYVF